MPHFHDQFGMVISADELCDDCLNAKDCLLLKMMEQFKVWAEVNRCEKYKQEYKPVNMEEELAKLTEYLDRMTAKQEKANEIVEQYNSELSYISEAHIEETRENSTWEIELEMREEFVQEFETAYTELSAPEYACENFISG